MKSLPPDANDFARMIERYNREMQQYVQINPQPGPEYSAASADGETASAAVSVDPTPKVAIPSEKATEHDAQKTVPAAMPSVTSAEEKAETAPPDAAGRPNTAPPPADFSPPERSREIPYPSTEDIVPLPQTRDDSLKPTEPAEPYPRNAVGFLLVQVFSARGVLPVEGATVTVSGTENGKPVLYHTVFTDRSGLSPLMALPAVSAQLSMRPGVYQPYTTYTVRVQKDGFYPVENTRVPIYEGIVARQPVNLVPLPENQREGAPQIFPENGPADL